MLMVPALLINVCKHCLLGELAALDIASSRMMGQAVFDRFGESMPR